VEIAERIGYRSTGHAMFFGENRPFGALLTLWAGEGQEGERARVTVLDAQGEEVSSFTRTLRTGMNRFTWELERTPPGDSGGRFGGGTPILPGEYTVRAEAGEEETEAPLHVRPDPRVQIPLQRRAEKLEALQEVGEWVTRSREAQERLQAVLEALDGVLARLGEADDAQALIGGGEALRDTLEAAMETLFTGPQCQGICGGDPVASQIRSPLRLLGSSLDAPSPNDRLAMVQGREALEEVVATVNRLLAEEVAPFAGRLEEAGYSPFPSLEPLGRGGGG
jgi:hypothetical protein